MNAALLLECLQETAPLSRATLAQMTGLNKATVSSLVDELLAANFIQETGLAQGYKGRPAVSLIINPGAGCIAGAELGGDFISVILTDFSAQILWRITKPIHPGQKPAATLRQMIALLREARRQGRSRRLRWLGLGVGVPGLVDPATGVLLFAPHLHWSEVPLRRMLEQELAGLISVDNEANMAALGESVFGAARRADLVLYVSAGVGLGGGLVLNHRLLRGSAGFAGEIGHMTLDPSGRQCSCGSQGCWETWVNQEAVFERVQNAVRLGATTPLTAMTGGLESLTVPRVVAAAQAEDAVALGALAETGRYLGLGLANLINALNPQLVVLGGPLSLGRDFLLPVIQDVVRQRALQWSRTNTEIVSAAYGADACVMGGVAAVRQRILSEPRQAARFRRSFRAGPPGRP